MTRFCLERHSSTGGGIVPLPFIGGLIHKSKTETVIGLTLRVIDVRTGEVVATATAESAVQQAITAAADKLLAAAPRLAHPDGAPGLAPFLRVP